MLRMLHPCATRCVDRAWGAWSSPRTRTGRWARSSSPFRSGAVRRPGASCARSTSPSVTRGPTPPCCPARRGCGGPSTVSTSSGWPSATNAWPRCTTRRRPAPADRHGHGAPRAGAGPQRRGGARHPGRPPHDARPGRDRGRRPSGGVRLVVPDRRSAAGLRARYVRHRLRGRSVPTRHGHQQPAQRGIGMDAWLTGPRTGRRLRPVPRPRRAGRLGASSGWRRAAPSSTGSGPRRAV